MKRVAILARISRFALLAGGFLLLEAAESKAQLPEPTPSAPLMIYKVVHEYPHDTHAYTEGLVYANGKLYESTGLVGQSTVRITDLKSGRVEKKVSLSTPYFGEGLAEAGNRWFQLTWKNEVGFIYDSELHKIGEFNYQGEGWGLTFDGRALIMSDGTPVLQRFDPDNFALLGKIKVHADDEPVAQLNELEYAKGRLYANIWQTDRIAVIDPITGNVTGWLDLKALHARFKLPPDWNPLDDVLNGIAFDPRNGHLFVTGKGWPKLFEIVVEH